MKLPVLENFKKHAMKTILLYTILFCFYYNLNAQQLKPSEIKKLSSLDLQYDIAAWHDDQVYLDFKKIIRYDKKTKGKKIAGFVVGGVGAAALAGSLSILNSKVTNRDTGEEETPITASIIGAPMLIVGAGCIGTSIPLFISSGRSKKRRDKLIASYNQLDLQNTSEFPPTFQKQ